MQPWTRGWSDDDNDDEEEEDDEDDASNTYTFFLRKHMQHMEVPRLGAESELQLLAYTSAAEIWDPSHVCDLYHSLQQW